MSNVSSIFSGQVIYQAKQAWQSLKGHPGFIASVLTTMGLTVGALLCILTLAYVLLVKPLPYPDQNSLYVVEHQLINKDNKVDGGAFTYPNLMYLYNNQQVFEQAALMHLDADVLLSLPANPMLPISFVTPEWFSLLGPKMALGRTFEQTEAVNTYNPVAVITYQTWQHDFAGKVNILDEKLNFSDVSYRIVGVLAESFSEPQLHGIGYNSSVILPWDYNTVSERDRKTWGNDDGGLIYLAKLSTKQANKTINVVQAGHALTSLVNDNWQEKISSQDFFKGWGINLQVKTLKSVLLSGSDSTVYLLLAGVLGLVMIACANIANLFISRTAEQQRSLAIKAAVGASKKQLFISIFSETSILMGLSTVIALFVASGGFLVMQLYLNEYLPRIDELSINVFTLSCAVTIAILLALFFAKLSANMINYHALNSTLQSSGKGAGIQVSAKIRNILITSQVAIVTALVFINITLFKDAINTLNQPTGYESNNRYFFVMSLPSSNEDNKDELLANIHLMREKLLALPQVEMISQSRPPSAFGTYAVTTAKTNERYSAKGKDIDHQYFDLINQEFLQGDNFSAQDIKNDHRVTIVNEVFAKQLAPDGNVLGLTLNGSKIIGVVNSIQIPNSKTIDARFYYPASPIRNMVLVKVKQGQKLDRETVVSLLKEVSSQIKLFSFASLNERSKSRLYTQYVTVFTSGVLALITLFLSSVGLYGILSYSTQMRRFELGTRMAIGAKGKDLIRLIIKDNLLAIMLGIALSMIMLLIITIGFNEQITNYLTLELLPLLFITLSAIALISFIACYFPLRQLINRPAIHSLKGCE
ncbi:MAG: ABC transporter permease [Colwellia sp.]|nr:ABC transporter permease [Colwellia sp.]